MEKKDQRSGGLALIVCYGGLNSGVCDDSGYDALNCVTHKSYADGTLAKSYADATPSVTYTYDAQLTPCIPN